MQGGQEGDDEVENVEAIAEEVPRHAHELDEDLGAEERGERGIDDCGSGRGKGREVKGDRQEREARGER